MFKHEIVQCNRCETTFECKVGSILLCQCYEVKLTEDEREFIKNESQDCLCANCLNKLKRQYHAMKLKEKMNKIIGTNFIK
ncbi:MAG: cysteine-rich CWC family protein [Crocinitomicaceae bacterium]|nr:cysteine-rich CWC family protein [Flavobacteriales bacterium]NQZ37834.1 cysteine-rich CWC family protein [Crocinitomicaceae bacterium]